IKEVAFSSPYAITIQLDVRDEIQAQRAIDRFHKQYKRRTGQRYVNTNFIGVLEKTPHFHCHILTDRNLQLFDYEQRVWAAIQKTKQIHRNYNQINEVWNSGWASYITKFEIGNEDIAIWETA
ncbi:MAG: hypothetical protein GY818_18710, partial [Planctomycetaceae bacterium]|nr:hypothetical protein [Planctomycetaceae bacterium]